MGSICGAPPLMSAVRRSAARRPDTLGACPPAPGLLTRTAAISLPYIYLRDRMGCQFDSPITTNGALLGNRRFIKALRARGSAAPIAWKAFPNHPGHRHAQHEMFAILA